MPRVVMAVLVEVLEHLHRAFIVEDQVFLAKVMWEEIILVIVVSHIQPQEAVVLDQWDLLLPYQQITLVMAAQVLLLTFLVQSHLTLEVVVEVRLV
jgi:hypothetical protein